MTMAKSNLGIVKSTIKRTEKETILTHPDAKTLFLKNTTNIAVKRLNYESQSSRCFICGNFLEYCKMETLSKTGRARIHCESGPDGLHAVIGQILPVSRIYAMI